MIKKIVLTTSLILISQPTFAAVKPSKVVQDSRPERESLLANPAGERESLLAGWAINMQDGGLILKESTIFKSPNGFELNVERTYRSRSFQKGYFGQGWCSDFESSLSFQKGGVVRMESCHSSRPLYFSLNKTASGYVNLENPDDLILVKLGSYERRMNSKLIAKYNFQGQLIEVLMKNKFWRLKYDTRKLPIQVSHGDKLHLIIKWHPLLNLVEKMETLSAPKKAAYQFRYDGFNLLSVISAHGISTYNYDDLDNMVLRQSPYSILKMEYNKDQDQIKMINSDCKETYVFKSPSAQKKVSTLTRLCPGSEALITQFEFDYTIDTRLPAHVSTVKSTKERLAQKTSNQTEL